MAVAVEVGEIRAAPFDAAVQVRGEGVEDHADDGDPVHGEAERYADVGVTVDKVCGSVYGVQDEGWGGRKGDGG